MTKQTWTAATAAILFVALAAVIAMVPVPYVVWAPGATQNLLAEVDGTPAVRVSGVETFPSEGELLMTTVAVTRSDASLTLPEALFSYWFPSREVLPREAVYPPGLDSNQITDVQSAQMGTSRSTAVVAALRTAGVKVTELPMVRTVGPSGPSANLLQPGDLITAVDNTAVSTREAVREAIAKHQVGDIVRFDLLRDETEVSVDVTTRATANEPDVPNAGFQMAIGYTYEPTVEFGIDPQVGGSSAGLMFSLTIYDLLTPGSVTEGAKVAGTGTIDATGRVSAIGGVQEKMAAAARDGATTFLLPRSNCVDIGTPSNSLRLIAVETLGDALAGLSELKNPDTATNRDCR